MKGWVYMNWVAPIKDSETLSKFKEALKTQTINITLCLKLELEQVYNFRTF